LLGGVQPLAAALARHRHARAPMPLAEVLAIRSACPAAEGRDADITTARYLLAHTAAYRAALIEAPTNQSSAQ
jgi:carboxyl-terminal processing protease